MTTGVDILFKKLPAQVPSVHRERKAAPSPVRADHVDDRSNISNNRDQKAIKTFNEHLDDHNVKNDDAHKTDKTPQTDSNETDALARNPEHGNNDVIATSEIPAESNIQDQGSNAVQLNNDILFAENAQENIAAATTEHSVVINTDINNVVDTNVSTNRADNNSGVNNTNPEQVVANTTGQPNTEKTIPAATDHTQNSEKSIPAVSADEATPKTTQPQHDNKIDATDVAADKNVEIKPDASIKETTPQNGLGDDNKLFTQTQKSSDARPVSTEVVQAPKGDENKIIPSSFVAQKTDVPMQDAKAETIVNSALLQQAPLEKTLPEETIVHEKNSAIPIAVVLDRNNNQKSTDKGKSTGISAGKSKSSSANQQKSDVPVSNTGQTTQTQQPASQNIVKNDMLFDMGLRPSLPYPSL
ncbi:MAG: hypothetical protein JKY84_04155 [Emcibacteraceae bacterium]|nr:hypothetical protein [Emcibacteraceae bacterium]